MTNTIASSTINDLLRTSTTASARRIDGDDAPAIVINFALKYKQYSGAWTRLTDAQLRPLYDGNCLTKVTVGGTSVCGSARSARFESLVGGSHQVSVEWYVGINQLGMCVAERGSGSPMALGDFPHDHYADDADICEIHVDVTGSFWVTVPARAHEPPPPPPLPPPPPPPPPPTYPPPHDPGYQFPPVTPPAPPAPPQPSPPPPQLPLLGSRFAHLCPPANSSTSRRGLAHAARVVCEQGGAMPTCPHTSTHDGRGVRLFRVRPHPQGTAVAVDSDGLARLSFQLEYRTAIKAAWQPLSWRELVPTHAARVHFNAISADGRDFFHTHMEGTDPAARTIVAALPLRHGVHLVAATWAVEATTLGLCVHEYSPHAHGLPRTADASKVYPLLQTSWLVHVGAPPASPLPVPPPAPRWPARRTASCSKDPTPWHEPPAGGGPAPSGLQGLLGFRQSFLPRASAECCGCNLNCSAPPPAAGCTAAVGCTALSADFVTLEDVCTAAGQPELGAAGNECFAPRCAGAGGARLV